MYELPQHDINYHDKQWNILACNEISRHYIKYRLVNLKWLENKRNITLTQTS